MVASGQHYKKCERHLKLVRSQNVLGAGTQAILERHFSAVFLFEFKAIVPRSSDGLQREKGAMKKGFLRLCGRDH